MNTNINNQDSLKIELNYVEINSMIEYSLLANSHLIKKFQFKANQIETFPRPRLNNEPDSFLFKIFDYKYIPSQKKVYLLMDEWGDIKLYSFHFDPINKEISTIKNDGKCIFRYNIRRMDTDLFQARSICMKYYDNSLVLLIYPPAPSPGKIFIKIPLDAYQNPVQLNIIKNTEYISERLSNQDSLIYINPQNSNLIIPIVRERMNLSPYSDKNFKYFFSLENISYQNKDINGKSIYWNDRFFFVQSNNKNIIILYDNFYWFFWEYNEKDINNSESIQPSFL